MRVASRKTSNRDRRPTPGNGVKQASIMAELMMLLMKIAMIALFMVMLFTFMFGISQVRDTSMKPAMQEGDLVIYYRLQKDYRANDVIAVTYKGKTQIRRVVAVSGDTVDIGDNGLMIGGHRQQESGIYTETLPFSGGIQYPVEVRNKEVFVLGDNRPEAEDGRVYGPVSVNATKGKVVAIIRRRNF